VPAWLIRQDLVPMVAGYLVIMTVLGMGLRRRQRPRAPVSDGTGVSDETGARDGTGARGGWPALIRYMIGTAVGGYLVLSAVVVVYYYGVARVGGQFLQSAFTGTALLAGIALPVFAITTWLTERVRRRRGNTTGEGRARSE
jgi:ABC-type Fe3+ transport system permease subunit